MVRQVFNKMGSLIPKSGHPHPGGEPLPHVGKRPINAITPRELLTVLRRVEERGALTIAHKALRDTGRIFRYAVVTGRAEHDIAADVRGALAPAANGHHAAITDPVAVGELLRNIYAYEGNFFISRALRLAPLVFVRASELIRTEWTEVDLEAAEWRIPAERMKMKQTHMVPQSPTCAESVVVSVPLFSQEGGRRNTETQPAPPPVPQTLRQNLSISSVFWTTRLERKATFG